MTSGPNVGFATLSIIPTADGFAKNLAKEVAPYLKAQGDKGGQEYGESFSKGALGKIGTFAKGGAAVAGVAIVGGLLDAMGNADVGAGLQASLGLSSEESAKFGKAAGLAYKQNYGESVAAVGDTIKAAYQAGLVDVNDSEKAIAGVVAQVETYAQLSGEDAVSATRAVGQMIKTGIAKNATEAFDILTRGQQLGINKSEDLLDTFNEYSTQFRKLGIDGPQALGLMNQAIQNGARDSDVAADAIKEFSIRAVDGSKTSADAFKALGLDAAKMTATFAKGGPEANKALQLVFDRLKSIKDPAAQSAAAVGLFGTQAEDLGAALLAMDPSSAAKGLGEVAGATDRANKALGSTPKAQIESFTRTLKQGFVETLGGQVLPALTKAAGDFKTEFGPAIASATAKLKEAGPPLLKLATTLIGNVVPGIAAVISGGATLAGFLAEHDTLTKSLVVTLGLLAAGFVAVKAVMAGLAVADFVKNALNIAKATRAWMVAQLGLNLSFLTSPLTWIVLAIVGVIAVIVLIATKTDWFQKLWSTAWGAIKTAASAVFEWVKTNWPLILAILTGPIGIAVLLIVKNFDTIKNAAGKVLSAITSAWKSVVGFFSGLPGKISAALGSASTYLVQKGRDFVNGLGKGVTNAAVSFLSWWSGLNATVRGKVGDAASALVQKGRDLIGGAYSGLTGKASDFFGWLGDLPGKAKSAVGDLGGTLVSAGKSLISGLVSGITSKFGDVKSTLGDLTGKLTSWKGPPARDKVLLTPAGQLIIDSLTAGFESRYDSVKASLGGFTDDLSRLPIKSATHSGAVTSAPGTGAGGKQVVINVHGANDPEATARVVGRHLANQGV